MIREMPEVNIYLPVPHERQAEFMDSPATRKIICAGRRGGKTYGIARYAVKRALEGRRVLEAAPTADQTQAFWEACNHFLAEAIKAGVIYRNRSLKLLEFPNGGRIRCKTAWDADTLRGDWADLLILDEYSIMSPSTWDEVGAPMLADNGGEAVFIFTPKRKNHAYILYKRAEVNESGNWAAFHFTSHANPHLNHEALRELAEDMTEAAYRQEILAEFLDSEGLVFRNIKANLVSSRDDPAKHAGHRLVAGVDWGKMNDYTVISVGCADCKREVDTDRFNKIEWGFQLARLQAMLSKWGGLEAVKVLPERNSIGGPLIDALVGSGVLVLQGPDGLLGFNTTAQTKGPLIESLSLSLEREEFKLINDTVFTTELEMYEGELSRATGRMKYSAPEGFHDDTVIARALMLWAANMSGVSVLW